MLGRGWSKAIPAGIVVLIAATAALGADGDLRLVGCAGTLPGCLVTTPRGASYGADGLAVAPGGRDLYLVSALANVVSHFTIGSSGRPALRDCTGDLAGCTRTSPAKALDGASGLALAPDGKHLFVAAGKAISEFAVGVGGHLAFRGCIGNLGGCTADPTLAANSAYPVAQKLAVTPDGRMLFATADQAVNTFTIDSGGNLAFESCIGDLPGCTATAPTHVLDGASGLSVAPDGAHLYVAAIESDVSAFTIGPQGRLSFENCVGVDPGCTPSRDLIGAAATAITPDGRTLLVSSFSVIPGGGATLSNFTVGADGSISLAGSQSNELLAGAGSLDVTPNGRQLYAASDVSSAVVHFTIDGEGNPRFAGCVGIHAGCTHTKPRTLLAGAGALAVDAAGASLFAAGTDALGQFAIAPAGQPRPKPVISRARIVPAAFRAATSGPGLTAKQGPTGGTISYRDSQASTVRLDVAALLPGRRSGSRCTPGRPRKGETACVRVRFIGSLSHRDRAGENRLYFSGRVRSRQLAPGLYRLSITPSAGGRTGVTLRLRFRVVR